MQSPTLDTAVSSKLHEIAAAMDRCLCEMFGFARTQARYFQLYEIFSKAVELSHALGAQRATYLVRMPKNAIRNYIPFDDKVMDDVENVEGEPVTMPREVQGILFPMLIKQPNKSEVCRDLLSQLRLEAHSSAEGCA